MIAKYGKGKLQERVCPKCEYKSEIQSQQGCTFWAVFASKCTAKMMNFSVLGVALLKMVRNDVLTKKAYNSYLDEDSF